MTAWRFDRSNLMRTRADMGRSNAAPVQIAAMAVIRVRQTSEILRFAQDDNAFERLVRD